MPLCSEPPLKKKHRKKHQKTEELKEPHHLAYSDIRNEFFHAENIVMQFFKEVKC